MSILRPSQDGFGKTLAGSLVLHGVIISLAALLFKSESDRVFITPVYTVNLVEAGAPKVTEAPLPEILKQEAPKEQEIKKSAPEAEKAPAIKIKEDAPEAKKKDLPKKAASVEDALKKLSAKVEKRNEASTVASRIEALRKKQETQAKETEERLSEIRQALNSKAGLPVKEAPKETRKAATATVAAGTNRAALESRYPAYYGMIRDKVQPMWIYPEELKADKLSVIVSIKLARTGKLIEASVEKSSGNSRFDESLINAIKKAAPFPPLPEEFDGSFLETGLRFCPGCAQ